MTSSDDKAKIAADCLMKTGFYPVVLPPSLYDRAEVQGYDMSGYIKSVKMPLDIATPKRP